MTAYEKTLSIISTIIKTILSIIFSVIFGAVVWELLDIEPFSQYIGWACGLLLFWKICPGDTKNWIKNWTKPQITK